MPEAVRRTRPGEVDPPQAPLGRVVELDEDVVVAERQAVGGLEAGRELPRERGMGPQEPDPGLESSAYAT